MKLTKFEKRKNDLVRKHNEELAMLIEAERKEREKLIEPVIEKISKIAAEEARRVLEKNPDILENYAFKKREAGRFLSEALTLLFEAGATPDENASDESDPFAEAPEHSSVKPSEGVDRVVDAEDDFADIGEIRASAGASY